MPTQESTFATSFRDIAAIVIGLVLFLSTAPAQTFNVIYNFTGGLDGAHPWSGLTSDAAGHLYGTTSEGAQGSCVSLTGTGCGSVYKLTHKSSSWVASPLYDFQGGTDGAFSVASVIMGPNGILYGTTSSAGQGTCSYYGSSGCGTVFSLRPQVTFCRSIICPDIQTQLYSFTGGNDGGNPLEGDLVFDSAGNLYGTTHVGGLYGYGAVYELTPAGKGWTESVIYSFAGGNDGASPWSNVILDSAGDIYGTTGRGGNTGCGGAGCGTVYELMPSGSGWVEKILYTFQGGDDGTYADGALLRDSSGNLYGGTLKGGANGGGTVYELMPSDGGWKFNVLYSFPGSEAALIAALIMDPAGNLYGTTQYGGANGDGSVFELSPSGNSWIYSELHDFTYGLDGGIPVGRLLRDASGNLYGTAFGGGTNGCNGPYGCGVVYEITP
jgi:uncharacterized repeat protein (TIGR03803 family)